MAKKILIIEDEEILINLLQRKLSQENYEITIARDGEEGLKMMKEVRPDLILLDLYMKQNDGWKVLSDIKQNNPHLPVLIVTAHDNYMKDPRLCLADGHVIKSIYFDELKKQIKQILQKKTDRLYFDEIQTTSESS